MKRIFFCFIILANVSFLKAQIGSRDIHDKVTTLIFKEYNTGDYKGIYKLLDKEFQKTINEKEFSDYYKFNVYGLYGDIKSLVFSEFRQDYYLYVAECKNGKVDLNLTCNTSGKIKNIQWLPHQEKLPEVPVLNSDFITTDNPKSNNWDLKIDSIANIFMHNSANCGLSIAIYKNKEISYYNYGDVKRGLNQLPNNKTIFEIGSVTKTFTGILLAQAILSKKMHLNDPVNKYLGPNYKNLSYKGKEIELVHLSNHSSRIHRLPFDLMQKANYDPLNPYANYTKEMVLKYLSNINIDTFPGVKNEYSNLGMGLLGILIEDVYTKTYEELIREYICQPMEMPDTKIELNNEQISRLATGYNTEGNETPHWQLGALQAAGGIRSTSSDMIKYVIANLNEVNPSVKLSHYSTYNDGKNNIALAWHLFTTKKGNELIWHNGRTAGFSSFCGFIKSKETGIVIMGNSGNPVDQVALGILKLLQ